jgi:hypothetical protein
MSAEKTEALEVLRALWRGNSQSAADLDCRESGSCKRMSEAGVGFDDFGGADEADRTAAWRARLEREGKLNHEGGTLRDIVFGTPAAR